MPDQVQTGGALSVEHGYNGLLANRIDLMELQQHYKWSIYVVFTCKGKIYNFCVAIFSDSILSKSFWRAPHEMAAIYPHSYSLGFK